MSTMTAAVLFNGEILNTFSHKIHTMRGLARVLAGYAQGGGWGLKVTMPSSLAASLKIYETIGGGLARDNTELAFGRIAA